MVVQKNIKTLHREKKNNASRKISNMAKHYWPAMVWVSLPSRVHSVVDAVFDSSCSSFDPPSAISSFLVTLCHFVSHRFLAFFTSFFFSSSSSSCSSAVLPATWILFSKRIYQKKKKCLPILSFSDNIFTSFATTS